MEPSDSQPPQPSGDVPPGDLSRPDPTRPTATDVDIAAVPRLVRAVRAVVRVCGLTLTLFFACTTAFATTCTATGFGVLMVGDEQALPMAFVFGIGVAVFVAVRICEWSQVVRPPKD